MNKQMWVILITGVAVYMLSDKLATLPVFNKLPKV